MNETVHAVMDFMLISDVAPPTAGDWQRILNMTTKPARIIICQNDPIMLVDALIEQLTQDQLKIFVDELVYRTKLFF